MNQWIQDHQAMLLLAWPVLSAAFSLLYTQLESMPRVHAALSFLAGFGIDLPTIWDAIGRLLKGNPPNSSGGGRGSIQELPGPQFKAPTAKPPGPPASARKETLHFPRAIGVRIALGVLLIAGSLSFVGASCIKNLPPPPPNTPADVEGALSCVVTALLSGGGNLVGCIAQWGPALVADALQMLVSSKQFAADHPELVPMLPGKLAEVRAQVHP